MKYLICVLIFIQFIFAQKIPQSEIIKNVELSIGYNYSEFYTTDNIGGNGISIGIYKRKELKNNWQIKTGINYSTNHSKLKNVTVLPMYLINWDSENYLYWRNFEFDYSYLEINTFLEIPILHYKNVTFNTEFGVGFEINLKRDHKIDNIKHEIYDRDNDKYDYWTFDNDVPPGLFTLIDNSDITFQAGSSLIYNRLVLNIYYELSIFGIRYIDSIKFGEKFHTFNTTLGFIIK